MWVFDLFSLEGKMAISAGGQHGIGKPAVSVFAGAETDSAICDHVADDGQNPRSAFESGQFYHQ